MGEDPRTGAARELFEETGIVAKPNGLKVLKQDQLGKERGLTFIYNSFVLELPELVPLNRQKYELVDIAWLPHASLSLKELSPVAAQVLATWSKA